MLVPSVLLIIDGVRARLVEAGTGGSGGPARVDLRPVVGTTNVASWRATTLRRPRASDDSSLCLLPPPTFGGMFLLVERSEEEARNFGGERSPRLEQVPATRESRIGSYRVCCLSHGALYLVE